MADEDAYSEEDQTLVIPKDHFVTGVNFDADPPTVTICKFEDNWLSSEEEELVVPKAMAWYLQTHSCGSDKMRALIKRRSIFEYKDKLKKRTAELKDAFGIIDEELK